MVFKMFGRRDAEDAPVVQVDEQHLVRHVVRVCDRLQCCDNWHQRGIRHEYIIALCPFSWFSSASTERNLEKIRLLLLLFLLGGVVDKVVRVSQSIFHWSYEVLEHVRLELGWAVDTRHAIRGFTGWCLQWWKLHVVASTPTIEDDENAPRCSSYAFLQGITHDAGIDHRWIDDVVLVNSIARLSHVYFRFVLLTSFERLPLGDAFGPGQITSGGRHRYLLGWRSNIHDNSVSCYHGWR